ncbi:hypothetical protein SAY87_014350 [Trapa incisa]|uniref:GAGA-binding transcriptional activator n=1 Tax=Trapa incisa TaxID=236973 RepID=A0AAN7GZV3_9MYRT|nr:hypothetical protein SAY87_014350 [Trapa incisa]
MDGEKERHEMDQCRGTHTNAVHSKRITSIKNERDTAIRERDAAIAEMKEALFARDQAIKLRDEAIAERDRAQKLRDNVIEDLKHLDDAISSRKFSANGMNKAQDHQVNFADGYIIDAIPLSSITAGALKSSGQSKQSSQNSTSSKRKKGNATRTREGSNYHSNASAARKFRSEWDEQDVGLNLIAFDESTMPGPVCSCTGEAHPCYKWGNGGWQSSCCTTRISMYPLPQMPNRRHARMSGRKMSGSVFIRLLTRMAKADHDLAVPLDLKDYWARHGTNRYIIIK